MTEPTMTAEEGVLTAQSLGHLLHRVGAALRAEVIAAVLQPMGLPFPQYICMRALARAPGMSNAELAREANVSPQAMHKIVRALERRGLIVRPLSACTGRALPIELTPNGMKLLSRCDKGISIAERRVLVGLSDDERFELRRLLIATELGDDGAPGLAQ